jgi:alkylhydroperoxidase/carboxymuconolactone decarboxylase family protein YurZ
VKELRRSFDPGAGAEAFYCPLLSAAIAAGRTRGIHDVLDCALKDGISTQALDETILQSHLFLGYPAMIEASRLLAQITKAKPADADLPPPYDPDSCALWHKQGMRKIKQIYGKKFDRLVSYVNTFSPEILYWMINDGYGKVLSRPGLSFRVRELCVVATLTVTSYDNQLRAHIRGALLVGTGNRLVRQTIENSRYFASRAKLNRALTILKSSEAEIYA